MVEGKMYSKVIETGLSYGDAMNKAILEGKKVSRAVWGGYWEKQRVKCFTEPLLVAVLKDNGGKVPANPYAEDMFALDWMVVE